MIPNFPNQQNPPTILPLDNSATLCILFSQKMQVPTKKRLQM